MLTERKIPLAIQKSPRPHLNHSGYLGGVRPENRPRLTGGGGGGGNEEDVAKREPGGGGSDEVTVPLNSWDAAHGRCTFRSVVAAWRMYSEA